MKVWFRSQLVVAGLLFVYLVLGIVWVFDPDAFAFPLNNLIAFFGMPFYVAGLILSLVLNQVVMSRRPQRVVLRRERVILAVEFALIVASLASLMMEEWLLEILAIWFVTTGVAIAACVVITVTSTRLRAASIAAPW